MTYSKPVILDKTEFERRWLRTTGVFAAYQKEGRADRNHPLQHAVRRSPVMDFPLYRGIMLPAKHPLLTRQEGETVAFDLDCFTKRLDLALTYADRLAVSYMCGYGDYFSEPVLFTLRRGPACGLDINEFMGRPEHCGNREVIVSGTFRVTAVRKADGFLQVALEP